MRDLTTQNVPKSLVLGVLHFTRDRESAQGLMRPPARAQGPLPGGRARLRRHTPRSPWAPAREAPPGRWPCCLSVARSTHTSSTHYPPGRHVPRVRAGARCGFTIWCQVGSQARAGAGASRAHTTGHGAPASAHKGNSRAETAEKAARPPHRRRQSALSHTGNPAGSALARPVVGGSVPPRHPESAPRARLSSGTPCP